MFSALEDEFNVMCQETLSSNSRGTTVAAYDPLTRDRFVFRLSKTSNLTALAIMDFCTTFAGFDDEFGLAPMSEPTIITIEDDTYVCEIYQKIISATGQTMDLLQFLAPATNRRHRLSALYYVKNVADTVARLHDFDFCHMDVSLENIVLSSTRAFLIDYESNMKMHPESSFVRKQDIHVPIKLSYCPIEHLESEKGDFVSLQAYDVWALGVILFAVFFGEYLFTSQSSGRLVEEEVRYFSDFGFEKFVEKFHPRACKTASRWSDDAVMSDGWSLLKGIFVMPQKTRQGDCVVWEDSCRLSADEIASHPMWNYLALSLDGEIGLEKTFM